jgi:osmotically-inducible protein OsmY
MKNFIYPIFVLGTMPLTLSAAGYQQQGNPQYQQGSPQYQQGGSQYQQGRSYQQNPNMKQSRAAKPMTQDDRRIHQAIMVQFQENDLPNAAAILITVEDGKVTLDGQVDTEENKSDAEQIAGDIDGVDNVENRLVVRDQSSGQSRLNNQQQFQQRQNNQMKQNLNTRSGMDRKNVADQYEKQNNLDHEKQNNLNQRSTVQNGKLSDQDLEKKVKEKLNSGWFSKKFSNVQALVSRGTVTLTGKVTSENERLEAEKKVRELSEVKNIINNIQVSTEKSTSESRY